MTFKTALASRPTALPGVGLAAAWALDETSGTTATELLGNAGRNGTYTGTVTLAQQALVPNGPTHPTFGGGYVTIPTDAAFSPQAGASGKIMVAALVRPTALSAAQMILTKHDGTGGHAEWQLRAEANGSILFSVDNLSGSAAICQVQTAAGVLQLNKTYLIVASYDVSGGFANAYIYVNGSLTAENVHQSVSTSSTASTAPVQIGRRSDGGGNVWAGQIGFAAIYGSDDYGFWEPITLQRLFGIEGSGTILDFGFRPDSATTLGKTETGETWTVPAGGGTWGVSSQTFYAASLGTTWPNPGAQAIVPFGQADMDVSAVITHPATVSDGVGIIARQSDAANFWFAFLYNSSGTTYLFAGKVVAGTNTYSLVNAWQLINTANPGPWRVRLRCRGDVIEVSVDGTVYGRVKDSFNNTAVNAGMLSYNAGAASYIRNFQVHKLVAPVTGGHILNEKRFGATGGIQTFTVPAGVTALTVEALGASGGDSTRWNAGTSLTGAPPGLGARVRCDVTVTPGETIEVYVGGTSPVASSPFQGGYNGGGAQAGDTWGPSVGGGGASDVRRPTPSGSCTIYVASFTGLPSTLGFTAGGSAPSGWSAANGVLTGATSTVNYWQYTGPADSGDRTVELELKVTGDPGGTGVNQMFGQWVEIGNQSRYIDVGFFATKIRIDDNGTQYDVNSGVATNGTFVSNYPCRSFNLSTGYHRVRLVIQGTTFYLYLDGELLYSRTIVRSSGSNACTFGQGTASSTGSWNIRKMWVATSAIHANNERLVVAGGGGGATQSIGGHGGLLAGLTSYDSGLLFPNFQHGATGGVGATQAAAGAGGTNGDSTGFGSAGVQGTGGVGSGTNTGNYGGGGGGGGYYGGGGGGKGANWGGAAGGGGSGLSTGVNELAEVGTHYGDGEVRISWESTQPTDLIGGASTAASENTNRLIESTDGGATWALVTTPIDSVTAGRGFVGHIAWSSALGLFVGVAGRFNQAGVHIVTSPDGSTWTSRSSPVDGSAWYARDVCWSAELGLFVVSGYAAGSLILTSPDGVTWTQRTVPSIGTLVGVAWSPTLGLFMAVGDGASWVTSPDGVTWTSHGGTAASAVSGATSIQGFSCVTWVPELGYFFVGGNAGISASAYHVFRSADGVSAMSPLMSMDSSAFTSTRCVAIAFVPPGQGTGPNAVGLCALTAKNPGASGTWTYHTSPDGVGSITDRSAALPFSTGAGMPAVGQAPMGFMGWDGQQLIAGVYGSTAGTEFAKSSDGISWTSFTPGGVVEGTGFGTKPGQQATTYTISLAGSIGLSGTVATYIPQTYAVSVAGAIGPTGTVIAVYTNLIHRAFAGAIGPSGTVVKQVNKAAGSRAVVGQINGVGAGGGTIGRKGVGSSFHVTQDLAVVSIGFLAASTPSGTGPVRVGIATHFTTADGKTVGTIPWLSFVDVNYSAMQSYPTFTVVGLPAPVDLVAGTVYTFFAESLDVSGSMALTAGQVGASGVVVNDGGDMATSTTAPFDDTSPINATIGFELAFQLYAMTGLAGEIMPAGGTIIGAGWAVPGFIREPPLVSTF